jgi:Fis family transcriptional regulator
MRYTRQNQSKAAKMLGINRGTFRKKLAFYGML